MTIEERAQIYHDKEYNCSQSTLCSLMDETGLSEQLSAQLATCFGGGMRCGNVCGAVTGGLMAIGCTCFPGLDPAAEKDHSTELAQELEEKFKAEIGTLLCDEIKAEHEHELCDHCIEFGAKTAKDIIERNKIQK